jgi:hypothetical protein
LILPSDFRSRFVKAERLLFSMGNSEQTVLGQLPETSPALWGVDPLLFPLTNLVGFLSF